MSEEHYAKQTESVSNMNPNRVRLLSATMLDHRSIKVWYQATKKSIHLISCTNKSSYTHGVALDITKLQNGISKQRLNDWFLANLILFYVSREAKLVFGVEFQNHSKKIWHS